MATTTSLSAQGDLENKDVKFLATNPAQESDVAKAESKAPGSPPGYKLVKVRRPDGTTATVKRKLSPEETVAAPNAQPPATEAAIKKDTTPAVGEAPKFKIVSVRKPDGSLVKVRRQLQPGEEAPPSPAAEVKKSISAVSSEKQSPEPKDAAPATTKSSTGMVVSSTEKSANGMEDAAVKEPSLEEQGAMQDALRQQEEYNRDVRSHRFKSNLLRGFGVILGSTIPALEVGDFMDGDEILSDDEFSEDDDDFYNDHHDGHEDDDDDEKTIEADGHGMFSFFIPPSKPMPSW